MREPKDNADVRSEAPLHPAQGNSVVNEHAGGVQGDGEQSNNTNDPVGKGQ